MAATSMENAPAVPKKPFGSVFKNKKHRLPSDISIVGLGCSSFSTFFWTKEESLATDERIWTVDCLQENHPRVQEWVQTIQYAVTTAGITLLDTAPWYGHGTSEVVIGWAMNELLQSEGFRREDITINTKIGRYEADPAKQFDFGRDATLKSVQRSLERMKCDYIDVLQLHDPEFAPSLDTLIKDTIPAMLLCQERGWCRALGMTGFPLEVQHQIIERSIEEFGRNVFSQSLTYGHYNLHDTSLLDKPIGQNNSFAEYCKEREILLLAAAPLSMGLLTCRGPPDWHPASTELKEACRHAASVCQQLHTDISTLALLVGLSSPEIPCTILGMGKIEEVKIVHSISLRFNGVDYVSLSQEAILQQILTENELKAWKILSDRVKGPFASIWEQGRYTWNGVEEARSFWKQLEGRQDVVPWQVGAR